MVCVEQPVAALHVLAEVNMLPLHIATGQVSGVGV